MFVCMAYVIYVADIANIVYVIMWIVWGMLQELTKHQLTVSWFFQVLQDLRARARHDGVTCTLLRFIWGHSDIMNKLSDVMDFENKCDQNFIFYGNDFVT